ncbi:two-component system, OmpR family, sensor histidine kinase KdpD [Actinacidiphila yanglinensis]|uniref:histidine kinase n=1 Tax=Actinacidiphila yanglinensis TaxID=310779 RepID=A0A1H6D5V4_9ACTN|nr:two-component system, OmpR family, sensor histidine kinase KdpD [Actinacidiphila yanglinensis]
MNGIPFRKPRVRPAVDTVHRNLVGSLVALACIAVLTAAMLPIRTHLSVATTALVLVVPVVAGVTHGGFLAGVLSIAGGFLVYDFFFIPPYLTLDVGASENWTALGIYAVIMLPVARVVAGMNLAQAEAGQRGLQLRRLFDLSTQLVQDRPLPELLGIIVTTLADVLDAGHVALLLPDADGRLRVAATAGDDLDPAELRRLQPEPGQVTNLDLVAAPAGPGQRGEPVRLALVAAGRPVGMLAISDATITEQQREPLLLFAHQIALAVERAQLRDEALHARLTQEVEHLARTLVAAVSHDLRSPLASIKASSSVLADAQLAPALSEADRTELARLVDTQTDRLAALVTNLLDMSRVQAGVLRPRTGVTSAGDLVGGVLRDLPRPAPRQICTEIAPDLPLLDVDPVLIGRVLTNLLDNAARYAPPGTAITVTVTADRDTGAAGTGPDTVRISVADQGPGIPAGRRDEVFGFFFRREADSGTGLGLAIAKIFVEAHGQRIWADTNPGGGARFTFTLPVAAGLSEENTPWPRSSSSTTTSRCSPPAGSASKPWDTGSAPSKPARRASPKPPSTAPTSSCSTSDCPTSTDSTSAPASAPGPICPSSSCPRTAPRTARSRPSTTAPTTT